MSTPMMHLAGQRLAAALVLGAALSIIGGCERDARGLTEWTPADHDHQEEAQGRRPARAQRRDLHAAPSEQNQVISVTWTKQCATCHGRRGRGDGPSSTMVKARDLTDADFQATLSDEQLAKVIREGKDKMPAFNLPDSIVEGLVQHVRGFVKSRRSSARAAEDRDEDEADETEADETEADEADDAPATADAPSKPAANAPASAPAAPTPPGQGGSTAPAQAPSSAPSPGSPTPTPHGAGASSAPQPAPH